MPPYQYNVAISYFPNLNYVIDVEDEELELDEDSLVEELDDEDELDSVVEELEDELYEELDTEELLKEDELEE